MQNEPRFHTLAEIYEIAKFHPFYRHALARTQGFYEAPITNKEMLYPKIKALLDNPNFRKGLYLSPSGGTTSSQVLLFPTDVKENHFQRACIAKCLIEEEILTSNAIALNLFGGSMMYRALEIFNDFCEKANATTLPVGSSCPDSQAYEIAIRFGANTIMGFPYRLVKFANYVRQNNLKIKIESIIFAGESLSGYQREYLQKTFNATRCNGLYGSTETGVWAYQPHGFEPDQYLFPPELMHVEIHNQNYEGFGKIIATNLVKAVHPLFLYDTGDIGKLTQIDYLNRSFNVLHLQGRALGCFYLGGSYHSLEDFRWFFTNLREFQIQISYDSKKARDKVRFCLVPPPANNSKKQQKIWESQLRNILMQNIFNSQDDLLITEVAIVNPDELIRSSTSQKVMQVVDLRKGSQTSNQHGTTYSIDINFIRGKSTIYRYK